jgi:hypothetical protein
MERKDGEAMEKRLSEIGKRIEDLKVRLGMVSREVKEELARRIEAVDGEQEEQLQRLHRLKDQGLEESDAPVDQTGIWEGLEKSLQELASRLKK